MILTTNPPRKVYIITENQYKSLAEDVYVNSVDNKKKMHI